MSHVSNGTSSSATDGAAPGTPEALEADVARQREQLAATVDELQAKLDVKTRAQAKVVDLKDRATTDTGKPRPELIGAVVAAAAVLVGVVVLRRRRR